MRHADAHCTVKPPSMKTLRCTIPPPPTDQCSFRTVLGRHILPPIRPEVPEPVSRPTLLKEFELAIHVDDLLYRLLITIMRLK